MIDQSSAKLPWLQPELRRLSSGLDPVLADNGGGSDGPDTSTTSALSL